MQDFNDLNDEQALWLQRIFLRRENPSFLDRITMPERVQDALVHRGLARRCHDGSVEVTLGGIREASRRPRLFDDAELAEMESA